MSECGSNRFIPTVNILEFFMTGASTCHLYLKTSNSVQVNLRLNVPLGTFFQDTDVATFEDKLAGLLDVTRDRVRIAGVTSGSTIVNFIVAQSGTITSNSSSSADELKEVIVRLR